jgi:sugar phosphate isomerase/epimerase
MKRRTFLLGTAALWAQPRGKFPKDARERLAVASWPFRKLVDPKKGTLPLADFPKMVVEKFGVRGIEPLDEHFPSTDAAYLEKFRNASENARAHVVNIPVGRLGGSFYDADAERRAKVIATAKHWIDVAAALNSPGTRMHIASAKTPPNVALAADALKEVAAYGEKKNVVVHLENDDPKSEEAFFLLDVLNAAATPWLRALPDFCNSKLIHDDDGYNHRALEKLFERAYAICHVKDSEQDGKKMYHADLPRIFEIAKAANYQGYFSMEYDAEGDPLAPTEYLIEASLRALTRR